MVLQLFGGEPDVMANAVPWVEDSGADIIDINMGCPVPKVRKSRGGVSATLRPGPGGRHRCRGGGALVAAGDVQDPRRAPRG